MRKGNFSRIGLIWAFARTGKARGHDRCGDLQLPTPRGVGNDQYIRRSSEKVSYKIKAQPRPAKICDERKKRS